MRQLFQPRIAAIRKNNHSKFSIRVSRDSSAETAGVAAVPDLFDATIGPDIPTESVGGIRMFGCGTRRKNQVQCFLLGERVGIEGLVPFRQIRNGGIDASIAEN